jgi:hypothetical protein
MKTSATFEGTRVQATQTFLKLAIQRREDFLYHRHDHHRGCVCAYWRGVLFADWCSSRTSDRLNDVADSQLNDEFDYGASLPSRQLRPPNNSVGSDESHYPKDCRPPIDVERATPAAMLINHTHRPICCRTYHRLMLHLLYDRDATELGTTAYETIEGYRRMKIN